jgi:hypothetical protein
MIDLNAEIADFVSATKGISLRLARVARVVNGNEGAIDSVRAQRSLLQLTAQCNKIALMLDVLQAERGKPAVSQWLDQVRSELRRSVESLRSLEAFTVRKASAA